MTAHGRTYCVALFDSVSHVMKAEKLLQQAGIDHKIIPVPKTISVDCGVCIRFLPEQKEAIVEALSPHMAISDIREIRQSR